MILKSQNSYIFDTPERSHHHDVENLISCDDSILGRGGFGVVVSWNLNRCTLPEFNTYLITGPWHLQEPECRCENHRKIRSNEIRLNPPRSQHSQTRPWEHCESSQDHRVHDIRCNYHGIFRRQKSSVDHGHVQNRSHTSSTHSAGYCSGTLVLSWKSDYSSGFETSKCSHLTAAAWQQTFLL